MKNIIDLIRSVRRNGFLGDFPGRLMVVMYLGSVHLIAFIIVLIGVLSMGFDIWLTDYLVIAAFIGSLVASAMLLWSLWLAERRLARRDAIIN
ncbi:MAG: hypothetical protein NUV56_00235 [Candidatus Uhrbacteria bacterium]|nr:hypothetical protein [Candidatus Uhrbacteria bacterium]